MSKVDLSGESKKLSKARRETYEEMLKEGSSQTIILDSGRTIEIGENAEERRKLIEKEIQKIKD